MGGLLVLYMSCCPCYYISIFNVHAWLICPGPAGYEHMTSEDLDLDLVLDLDSTIPTMKDVADGGCDRDKANLTSTSSALCSITIATRGVMLPWQQVSEL